jgi:hypothetical protein
MATYIAARFRATSATATLLTSPPRPTRASVLALLLICAPQVLSAAPKPIYKCTDAGGAISFSTAPCQGKSVATKIVPTQHEVGSEPVLPGNIPGRRGQLSPPPVLDTRPKRLPTPAVGESCRTELFSLKRELDNQFNATDVILTTERAALQQNSRELNEAQTSKVGAAWSLTLTEQRRAIEARLRDAETARTQFYPDEKRRYEELAQRCKK